MTKVILKKIRKEMPVILPPGAKGEIAKALGCGRATVWAALVNNRRGTGCRQDPGVCVGEVRKSGCGKRGK